MNCLIIFALVLAGVFASPSQGVQPRNRLVPVGRPEGRVFKGQKADVWQFPYQVGLLMQMRTYERECGGSVIGNTWVLTAAHCTNGARGGEVYMGGTTYDNASVLYFIKRTDIIVHPRYNRKTLENDISLIRIPYIGFNVEIQRVDLPALSKPISTFVNEGVVITGWGRYKENSGKSSEDLLWGHMTVIPNTVCAKTFKIYASNICSVNAKGVNVCTGDSGGPVVWKPNDERIQVGIISWGARKCKTIAPAVHTRVSSYLEWIKNITGIYY